jgi:CDGSH-type Zn-finger protein
VTDEAPAPPGADDGVSVEVRQNGPIVITGTVTVTLADGSVQETSERVFLCRCGGSSNKPYCDGTHKHNGFRAAGVVPPRKPDRP